MPRIFRRGAETVQRTASERLPALTVKSAGVDAGRKSSESFAAHLRDRAPQKVPQLQRLQVKRREIGRPVEVEPGELAPWRFNGPFVAYLPRWRDPKRGVRLPPEIREPGRIDDFSHDETHRARREEDRRL